jgi:uncharacterized protein (DUF58 family)
VRPPRTRGFAGPIPARQSGSGVDFFGVREYQMGDRLRWMNWRVSARRDDGADAAYMSRVAGDAPDRIPQGDAAQRDHGRYSAGLHNLFTNEFEQERIADIGLILDARQQNDVQTAEGSLFDHATQATASLAEMFLEAGNRVGLLIYGRGREGVFPGYGHVQRERILRALGRTATGHNYALESLNHLPTRFFPARSQIVFIGALNGTDDVAVLTGLRANGYAVMVVSPNPVAFEAQSLAASGARGTNAPRTARQPGTRLTGLEYANRLAQVERRLALLSLQRVGVQVVDWRVDQSLDLALAAASPRGHPATRLQETRG